MDREGRCFYETGYAETCGNARGERGGMRRSVAGGGLMMQGMRYVRPTAENWSLLPYAEPAAKVEQTVGWSSKGEEFSRDYVSLTGYDEQEREIWKKSRFYTAPGTAFRAQNL